VHTWTPRVQEDYEQYRANGAKLVHFGLIHSAAVQRRAARAGPCPRALRFRGAETLRRAYLPEYQLAPQRSRGAHRMHARTPSTHTCFRVRVCFRTVWRWADLASTIPSSSPGHRSRLAGLSRLAGAGEPPAARTSAQRALPRRSSRPSLPSADAPPSPSRRKLPSLTSESAEKRASERTFA
jgi:hypothetical protein